jgi:hypothetical protein
VSHEAVRTIVFASLISLTSIAMAAPEMQRVRGTVESADGNSITIKTIEGKSETVSLADEAKFALVVKSSLDAIKDGVFNGTATKGDDQPTALDVVIFQETMRGAAEGHYDWDMIPDTVAGGTRVKSAMTNGTVKASPSTAPKVNTSMTNATVAKSTSSGEDKILTVTYDRDQSKTIAVPPKAPIVAFETADKTILKRCRALMEYGATLAMPVYQMISSAQPAITCQRAAKSVRFNVSYFA